MHPNFIFILLLLSSSIFTTHSYYTQCVEHQKRLLLQLKDELIFDSSFSKKLVHWNERENECCKWYGVECDAAGNVVSLQLDNESISGGIGDSSSLFRLEYLEKLNLANNYFNFTEIPRGIHNLSYLTHLNLAYASFGGQIPAEISSLTRLVSLDISTDYLDFIAPLTLEYPNLEMFIQNLTRLRELLLDNVDMPLDNLSTVVSYLAANFPSLTTLSLGVCQLQGSIPSTFANLTKLIHFDLGYNLLEGSIPSTFANLTKLIHVDLSNNYLTGSLPSTLFKGLSSLVHLDMGLNSFSGKIPHSLFGLPSLLELYLGDNQFNGIFQLDKLRSLSNLTGLVLSHNSLSVDVSRVTYGLPQLKVLYLGSCNLSDFPVFIKKSDMIRLLDLSNNRIAGEVPTWIWGAQLLYLNLSFNLLMHVQKPYHIPASLLELYLNSNKFRGELSDLSNIPPGSQLSDLSFAHNNLSGSIPTSLFSATHLNVLDLSYNKLSGSIPDNLSDDCSLEILDLSNNALEGKIPVSLKSCRSLVFMNVGKNNINDSFPCMLSPTLHILVLHSNRFHGEITCHNSWPELQIIDISSNFLGGSLESINFSSWSAMVIGSDSQISWGNTLYFGGYYSLLSSIQLIVKGLDLEYQNIWINFSTIDFSCNKFTGEIPNAIGDLRSLHLLNFSGNALNGSIPKSFGRLSNLESLDLSRNRLTGRIPMELGGLTFLSFLNLSYNKLVGEIPNSRQLQTFSADSFEGNPGMCGLINLNLSCSDNDGNDLSPREEEEVEDDEIGWEYTSVALGYVVGLGSIVWLLLFYRRFRDKYFDKIEEVAEEILDRRKRKRRSATRVVRHGGRRQ